MPNTALGPFVLMFVAGIGIPIMAALNADLGTRMASPQAATVFLFVSGTVIAAIALLVHGLPPKFWVGAPPRDYLSGFLVAFYVLSITWAVPRIGVGNAIFLVLVGQLVSAAAIDHFALFGAQATPITARRALGIAVMMLGVFLAKKV